MSYEPRRWYLVVKGQHSVRLPLSTLPLEQEGIERVLNAWHHSGYEVWQVDTDNRNRTRQKRLREGR